MTKQLFAILSVSFSSISFAQNGPISKGELGVVVADTATGIRTVAKTDQCNQGANPGYKVEKDQSVKIIARSICYTNQGPMTFLVVDHLKYRDILNDVAYEGPAMVLESGVIH